MAFKFGAQQSGTGPEEKDPRVGGSPLGRLEIPRLVGVKAWARTHVSEGLQLWGRGVGGGGEEQDGVGPRRTEEGEWKAQGSASEFRQGLVQVQELSSPGGREGVGAGPRIGGDAGWDFQLALEEELGGWGPKSRVERAWAGP